MTRVKHLQTFRTCALCQRTLLLGERVARYTPGEDRWVDVCALCTDSANEQGWLKEGTPTTPMVAESPARRRRFPGLGLLEARRVEAEPVVTEPVLRRLSPPEQALVEAAERFNGSPYSRTIAAVAKSLGDAHASMLLLSGPNTEVVITIAWDISWYQYRVVLDSSQPVRLAERGHELAELADRFKDWNASLDRFGRLVPDISPV